jgi:hypothetical protein
MRYLAGFLDTSLTSGHGALCGRAYGSGRGFRNNGLERSVAVDEISPESRDCNLMVLCKYCRTQTVALLIDSTV